MMKLVLLLIFIALNACAARPTPIPEMRHKDAMLFSEKCGLCHSVPHPKRHTYKQWEHMMTVMEKQMKHKGISSLGSEEKIIIMGYLKRHSR